MKKLCAVVLICLACFVSLAQGPSILVPFRVGSKWGYSDTLGKIKIKPVYDSVSLFDYSNIKKGNHVIAAVILNGKQTFINEKGAILVPPRYDHVQLLGVMDESIFGVSSQGKWGVFTKRKELFPPLYDYMNITANNYFEVHRNGKWGLINAQGKIVIPVAYDELYQNNNYQVGFVSWTTRNYNEENERSHTFKTGGKNFFSVQGPLEYVQIDATYISPEARDKAVEKAKADFELDSVQIRKNSGIVYRVAKQGVFLPNENTSVYFFSKDYTIHHINYRPANTRKEGAAAFVIVSLNRKFGIITETENIVLPFVYDSIEEANGFYLLKQNGQVGFFIQNTHYPVIRPAYDEYLGIKYLPVNESWRFALFEVKKAGKRGFVGENGVAFFKD